ncbi:MAG: family 10 glycosylhydrolase, partial [Aureliella sp.]
MTVGHGGPRVQTSARRTCLLGNRFPNGMRLGNLCAGYLRLLTCLLATLYVPCFSYGQTTSSAASAAFEATTRSAVQCELRVVWGGKSPRPYAGSMFLDGGTLKVVRNLSLQQDSIGKIDNAGIDRLDIRPHSPCIFGGVDIAVRGQLDSRVNLRIDDPLGGKPREFDVSLAELLEGEWIQTLDDRGNRLAIGRQVVDRLRVDSEVEPRILAPNQTWRLRISGHRTGVATGGATAELRLVAEDGQTVGRPQSQSITIDEQGSFPATSIEFPAPLQEGAYHLEISLQRRSMLNALVSTPQTLLRRLDMVVFDAQAKPPFISDWKLLATIDPLQASKPGSLAWLATMDALPSLGRNGGLGIADILQPYNPLAGAMAQPISFGGLGARDVVMSDTPTGELRHFECLSIAPRGWLALPLQGLQDNVPHRLRVRIPTDHPIELAISLQQTNALSEFPPLSLDSGVVIRPRHASARSDTSGAQTTYTEHEIVFWPRGQQAFLVLANTHAEQDASVCEVLLERAEFTEVRSGEQSPPAVRRMVGINLDKPLLADSVSTKREVDPVTSRALESWGTWQTSIARICQMMQLRQANTLLVKGFSEGGAIFPSERLAPTCRYDSGTFFSDGRSPEIKDAIELMLQHFDRDGLQMILALDLNTTLPALSRFENSAEYDALLQQPISSRDKAALGEGTRYNPLSPRVQEEIVATLREIVNRYGHHGSFAGVAVQLDDQSQLVFAGDRWGYDSQTLADFEKHTQVKLPKREQLETAFSGAARLAFLEWRAGELTKFYARLGDIVRGGHADRKLYLNAIRLWDDFPSESRFFNPKEVIRNPREYMLAFGISPERLAESPQVELMRGSFDAISNSVNSVNSQDWIRRESGQRGLVEFYSATDTSAVVLRYPGRFEIMGTEQLDHSATRWIYPTLSHPGAHSRKKLINQIYHSDPLLLVDGGWLPFSGQEDEVLELMQTLNCLPPIKLDLVALREPDSNLRVRLGQYENKSYVQIVNNAPWEETLKLGIQTVRRNAQTRVLGDHAVDLLANRDDAGLSNLWTLNVAPYEIIGIEVDDPHLSITSLQHSPPADTATRIGRELSELETLVAQSADVTQQPILADIGGDFEGWDAEGQPIGWSVSSLPQVTIAESRELPHSGGSSLQLENTGKSPAAAWAQSRPFAPPQTGRLAVQAWFRAPAIGAPPLVKLAVVGRTHAGQRFERAMELGGRADSSNAIAFDWGRKPATLYVGDVSSESVAELTVSIELIGPGKVWVDDVQVFESLLQPDERNHLRGE